MNPTFFHDIPAVFPQIDKSVGIYLNVFLVVCQQQVQYVVAVELGHPAPAIAANGTALHLLVVFGVDPVDERPHSHLVCHKTSDSSIVKIFKILL